MAYWAEVTRRAWVETAKIVKLDSRKLLMVLVLGQVVIGTILNLQEENAALRAQMSELRHSTDADYPFDMRQRATLVAFLSKVPAEARFVIVVRHSGFSGSSDYARRMARAFREAGWAAQVTPDLMVQPTNEGVHLASCRASTGELDPLSANGELLRDALNEAEIKFSLSGHAWPDDIEKPSSLFFVFPPGV